jgi:hypothetical protein
MEIDGSCHCGYITYEAVIDPARVAVCHCTDCQTLSGSAFRTFVPAARDMFNLRSGQPNVYVKTADSGTERAQAFCPECGTPIYSAAVTDTPMFVIRVGTIRQRADLRPRRQYWCRSALGWVMDLGSVTQVAEQEGLSQLIGGFEPKARLD